MPHEVGGEYRPSRSFLSIEKPHFVQVKFISTTKGLTTLILTTVPLTDISLPVAKYEGLLIT
jgi:hypothetical protein